MSEVIQPYHAARPGTIALLGTALAFATSLLFLFPLYNSGDDAFFAYTLGGGFGEAPTNLLHYNYGWHYWLGGLVKQCFLALPGMNAYSLFLLLLHYLGFAAILFVLLRRLDLRAAIFFATCLFLFIEIRQLLTLTYSGAAMVAGTGGLLLFLDNTREKKWLRTSSWLALALVLAAGMTRMHMTFLAMAVMLPLAFMIVPRTGWIRCGISLAILAAVLLGLFKLHENYYRNNIPGWPEQESFRQSLIYAYNRPLIADPAGVFLDEKERQLFQAGFLYDRNLFTTDK